MIKILKFINSIHDVTYIFFVTAIIVAILSLILSIYYTAYADILSNPIIYHRIGGELIISARDVIIEAVVYSSVIEFMIRNK